MTVGDRRGELAREGEDLAARLLTSQGYAILARNWRPTGVGLRGELDIVASRDGVLAIVEVKTRRSARYGGPLGAVTAAKQARIRRLAGAYLQQCGRGAGQVRFDVIGVVLAGAESAVEHVEGAF